MGNTIEIRFENFFQGHESDTIETLKDNSVYNFRKAYNYPTNEPESKYRALISKHFSYEKFNKLLAEMMVSKFVVFHNFISESHSKLDFEYVRTETENGKQYFVIKVSREQFDEFYNYAADNGNNDDNTFAFIARNTYEGYIAKNVIEDILDDLSDQSANKLLDVDASTWYAGLKDVHEYEN